MIIDLSVPIDENTPVYPGDPALKIEPAGTFEKDNFRDHVITIGTHVGTHIDAPMHMLEDGVALDKISPERFVANGVCIDVRNSFLAVKEANVQEGDIVLLYTGMSRHFKELSYFQDYPPIPVEIAEYLVQKKVNMVGTDTCSPDGLEDFPIHRILLGGDVIIIENLTNLDQLLGKEFTVYALPIALKVDAAPARVLAKLN